MVAYDDFPAQSRVWIYQSDRALTTAQVTTTQQRLQQFVAQWQSHGKPVRARAEVLHQHFLVLMVDERYEAPSGCSIDSSVALIKELEQSLQVDFFDRMTFTYVKADGSVAAAKREAFAQLYAQQEIDEQTTVFNNLVTTKDALEKEWKVNLGASWHANMV